MLNRLYLLLAGAFLFAAPVMASTITFSFGGSNVVLPSPHTFTVGGVSVSAMGYVTGTHGWAADNLFAKNGGASEDGLGLAGTSDDEINPRQAIELNLSKLIADDITGGTFSLGSLQTGEQAEICWSSSNSVSQTFATSDCLRGLNGNSGAIGTAAVTWDADPFVFFFTDPGQKNTSGNYLVNALTVSTPAPTPEPSSVILLGSALLAMALFSRRRLAALLP